MGVYPHNMSSPRRVIECRPASLGSVMMNQACRWTPFSRAKSMARGRRDDVAQAIDLGVGRLCARQPLVLGVLARDL